MTIYPRGKKKIYCADFWHDGKHQRVSLETRNKKVATQRAVKIDADLTSGRYSAPPPPTKIETAVNKYLAHLKAEGRARKTIVRYQGELEAFRDFCHARRFYRLSQITVLLFDEFRADRRQIHVERTVFHESVVVKQWIKWGKTRKLLPNNPLEDYRLEKPRPQPKGGPSLEQVNSILTAAQDTRRAQFAVLAFGGMRSGELQHLQRAEVDLEGKWLHIVSRPGAETKTRESRKVPIHPRLYDVLKGASQSAFTYFFTTEASPRYPAGGNWINPKRLNEDFIKILEKFEIPAGRKNGGFTIHCLRHFFKTHCINCGVPKPVVDTWQGHKIDMSVGAQYYKLADEASQDFMTMVSFDTGESAADADN